MEIKKRKDRFPNRLINATHKRFVGLASAHGHDFFELELILSGKGTYHINGKSYPVEPNRLFLMSPAQIHSVTDADVELINVMFQFESDKEFFPFPIVNGNIPCVFRLQEEDSRFLRTLLSELLEVQSQNPHYASLLLQCTLCKLQKCATETADEKYSSYIQRSILYTLENFRNGITMESTAEYLGLSKNYFSEYFSTQMGITYKAYLDDIRFSYVQNLLTYTDLSVFEIHERAGFLDYANFSRRFKLRYGCSPAAYRKQASTSHNI